MIDKRQPDRFKNAAKVLGADESEDALDRIMGKLDLKKKPETTLSAIQQRSSDKLP